ncbi:MAG: family transcriptional regulator, cyclic receptor protein [Actinomycetota bacterium]|nr:family transcriptional regulator, cyclic receptor protein [Actinomycetota bacterium]
MDWPLLDVLSEPDRRELLARARRRRFARHEVLFHEGDPGDSLHLVSRGHIALRIHTPFGDIATMRIVRPGEFFGELAVVSPGPRNATAAALDAAETIAIDRELVTGLRDEHPQISALIVEALVSEVRRLAQQVVEAMYVPVDKRVWRRLEEMTKVFGANDTPETTIPITQDVLAQLSGCTRPTTNRVLRVGENAGIIEMARGRIEIHDFAALQRRAR